MSGLLPKWGGAFVRGGICPGGLMSGGGGFCPGGECPTFEEGTKHYLT